MRNRPPGPRAARARRHLTLYLGPREDAAFTRGPDGMQRGRWLNLLIGEIVTWPDERWAGLRSHLAPRPAPREKTGKLSIAILEDHARTIERHCPGISPVEVVRTVLLRAARVPYNPVPLPVPWKAPPADAPADRPRGHAPSPGRASVSPHPTPARPVPATSTPAHPKKPAPPPRRVWRVRDPDQEELDTFAQLRRDYSFNADICHPDLLPAVHVDLADWLAHAKVGERKHLLLGIAPDEDGDLVPVPLQDPDATASALKAVCDASGRSYLVRATPISWGDDPTEICVMFEIRRIPLYKKARSRTRAPRPRR